MTNKDFLTAFTTVRALSDDMLHWWKFMRKSGFPSELLESFFFAYCALLDAEGLFDDRFRNGED